MMSNLIDDPCMAFLEEMTGQMTAWARARGVSPEDAEEIVQDAKLAASRQDRFMEHAAAQRATWLKQQVNYRVRDVGRYQSRDKRDAGKTVSLHDQTAAEPLDDGTSPSAAATRSEWHARLLAQLPEGERQVCTLYLIGRRTPAEIAAELNISAEDAAVALARGLARLKPVAKQLLG